MRTLFVLFVAALFMMGGVAGPAWSQRASTPITAQKFFVNNGDLHADVEDRVRSFLEAFIDGANTPAQQLEFFADQVLYYNQGMLGKAAMGRDIQYTMRRWPRRNNRLVEIEYLKPLPEEDKVFVSYVVDYEVANASRIVYGTALYGAVISGLGEQPRIEGILERVVKRRRISILQ
jgi:hypothetical protein